MDAEVGVSARWYPHVTVACVARRDGKYLLVEERRGDALVYNQPAGHLERGETLVQAVVREAMEETGYRFAPTHLCGVYQFIANDDGKSETYLRFAFAGEVIGAPSDAPLDDGIERVVWLARDEIEQRAARLRSPAVLACVADFEAGRKLPLDIVQQLARDVA